MNAHTDTGLLSLKVKNIASSVDTRGTRRAGTFTKRIRLVSGLLFAALSASLTAQTHFCVGGDLDHMSSAAITACQAKMSGVRDAAKRRGVPAGWHFVVVCDEAGWKDYTRFSRQQSGLLSGASYSTDPQLRWTFLRGSELNVEQPEAAATMLSTALENVPKSAPQFAPARPTRQLSIAMAGHDDSTRGLQ